MGVFAKTRRFATATCDEARESLSAAADGEKSPLAAGTLHRHVARCESCRAFADDVVALNRTLRVHAANVLGDGESAVLSLIGIPARPERSPGDHARGTASRRSRRVRHGVAVGALWAAALIPLGFAVPALASGSFAHVHIVGTHTPSPCTLHPAHTFRD